MIEWEVNFTDEFKEWFEQQTADAVVLITARIFLLREFGPGLPRPYSDTLKGSKLKNLKELRTKTEQHVFRIAYLFDETQKAILLVGGDKKGKNEKRFYKKLINQAEQVYNKYIDTQNKGEQKNAKKTPRY